MGLLVSTLELRDWRNFEQRDISFAPGMTVLHGHNAVGKTNTVEALQLLTAGASFRKPRPIELVREGAESAKATMHLRGDGRVIDVACLVEGSRRKFRRNGKPCQSADVPETLMSVLFNPDDLAFVKQGASQRRGELDSFGRQANRGFAKVLAAYQRAVDQRNRLLKEDSPNLALLDAWDASVALGGATLLLARLRLFERLVPKVSEVYAQICNGEELSCSYQCSLGDDVMGMQRDELTARYLERLSQGRPDDLRRQQTLVGPHRDDFTFTIDGRDARTFGSQGQQRSVVLAWKMAEVELSAEILGEQPLLLLDDVMSELDEQRRAAVVSFVQKGIQTVVTTTNLGYFPDDLLAASEVVSFGE
ncbi:MAG: DNA replication and repair protein RecF [Atopobiaceae bacterium]|nr:DNA replication and repair protein RecF [Atopobiaceae bacterium]